MHRVFLIMAVTLFLPGFVDQISAQNYEPLVVLETNLGNIVIEFFPDDAPNHVANFIELAGSGSYDGTLFHRIIPGFMIQGGDPNTINGDPSTWGTGGLVQNINAEFNTIEHDRGIVSMARATDPDSAGSQFFIVHQDSNNLDGGYTVFGRIVTDESFATLDVIASVPTDDSDRPEDPEPVKVLRAYTADRSEIPDILELAEPERMQLPTTPEAGNQEFESEEHGFAFIAPDGWLLQESDGTQADAPDVYAVGPKTGATNPVITVTVHATEGRTLDVFISEQNEKLKGAIDSGTLNILSQEKSTLNGHPSYVTNAEGYFFSEGMDLNVKFMDIAVYTVENIYVISYSNALDDFDSLFPKFEETLDSFNFGSDPVDTGGCLIATATYGSELAPQVQQLRELRDNMILPTESGAAFMAGFNEFYYSFSPAVADLERESPVFKEAVKLAITPMLSTLSILNYVDIDSEQEMLGYGISLILLNAAMYLAAPAVIIYKIRN